MIWYILLFLFSSICVIHSLECYSCEFEIKVGDSIPDKSLWSEDCLIHSDDIELCKGYIQIDYLTGDIYIWWNAIKKENVKQMASNFDIPLPLNQNEKSLIKYQFDIQFQPDEGFSISAVIFCQSNDFCIIEETRRLLSQLSSLKHDSLKIRKEFGSLLIKSSLNESRVMCFHSFSQKIVECTSTNDAVCFIGILDGSSQINAGCARDSQNLFLSVSSYLTITSKSNINHGKSSCSIHCNQENCNTEQVYTKIIHLAQKYVSGIIRTHRRR